MIPTIETARLVLRAHELGDFEACAALWGDPAVVRYIGKRPSSRQDAWARLLRYRGHWELLGYGFWAIVERATGAFVGECGLADFHREVLPAMPVEAGWVLVPAAHGKGYATEAMRGAFAWGAANLSARDVGCVIEIGNEASFAVARKLGFVETTRMTVDGDELVVLHSALHT